MGDFLILRIEGPMQAWGSEAVDPRRPSGAFPRRSALTGLVANALGWQHRDADRITALQDRVRYAVREDRGPTPIWDFQTADLGKQSGWGRWGPTRPGGGSADGNHILRKEYLCDARFTVAMGLNGAEDPTLDHIEHALARPARPLFLGRKSCPPSAPILRTRIGANSPLDALIATPVVERWPGEFPSDRALDSEVTPGSVVGHDADGGLEGLRVWCDPDDWANRGPAHRGEVWDRRNYLNSRFDEMRWVVEARLPVEAHE